MWQIQTHIHTKLKTSKITYILSSNSGEGKIISQPLTAMREDEKPEKWIIQDYNANNIQ